MALNRHFDVHMPEGTRAIMLSAAPQAQAPPPGTPTDNWATDYLLIEAR